MSQPVAEAIELNVAYRCTKRHHTDEVIYPVEVKKGQVKVKRELTAVDSRHLSVSEFTKFYQRASQ